MALRNDTPDIQKEGEEKVKETDERGDKEIRRWGWMMRMRELDKENEEEEVVKREKKDTGIYRQVNII